MLALPLGVIASNFGEYEKYSKRRKKVLEIFEEIDDPLDSSFRNKNSRKYSIL